MAQPIETGSPAVKSAALGRRPRPSKSLTYRASEALKAASIPPRGGSLAAAQRGDCRDLLGGFHGHRQPAR